MKCEKCGHEFEVDHGYCPECGASTQKRTESYEYAQGIVVEPTNQDSDKGGFGWGMLGCCVPVAGLVLFLVWKDSKPKTAKAAGVGALLSVILSMALYMGSCTLGVIGALL